MANPQLEDGHTRIANEILENLMRLYLPPNQWQVLLCIIRKTYGYKKKVDWIANYQIVEATGLVKSTVSRALKSLEQKELVYHNNKSIGFQKDWEQWQVSSLANSTTLESVVSGAANSKAKVSNPANPKKLAIQPTELAIQPTELAIQPTKVSSPRVTQKKKETIQKKVYKRKYGEFQNILLTDEEYQWLRDKLGDKTSEYIEKLSGYLESTGRDKYKSHYATILNWYRRDGDNKTQRRGVVPLSTEEEIARSIKEAGQ